MRRWTLPLTLSPPPYQLNAFAAVCFTNCLDSFSFNRIRTAPANASSRATNRKAPSRRTTRHLTGTLKTKQNIHWACFSFHREMQTTAKSFSNFLFFAANEETDRTHFLLMRSMAIEKHQKKINFWGYENLTHKTAPTRRMKKKKEMKNNWKPFN